MLTRITEKQFSNYQQNRCKSYFLLSRISLYMNKYIRPIISEKDKIECSSNSLSYNSGLLFKKKKKLNKMVYHITELIKLVLLSKIFHNPKITWLLYLCSNEKSCIIHTIINYSFKKLSLIHTFRMNTVWNWQVFAILEKNVFE